MITCDEFLDRVKGLDLSETIPCLCTAGCGRYWQLRARSRWSWLAWWRTTVPGPWGTVWVRLSAQRSEQIRIEQERG